MLSVQMDDTYYALGYQRNLGVGREQIGFPAVMDTSVCQELDE